MKAIEINFDGIIGPTHHYGGLADGNLASLQNQQAVSHPRQAALEGLAKMKLLADRGIGQGVLPPHPRPHWEFLRRHGLQGTEAEIIQQAAQGDPHLLSIAYSAAAMWTANAATVSPSADTDDGRVHFTPANLISTPHRQLESGYTTQVLRKIFADHRHFVVHDPLPCDEILADEGAANQMRLCHAHGDPGIEIFVYGRDVDEDWKSKPMRFPARQTKQAGVRIAALHGVPENRRLFLKQNPEAIDAGVFHNDVIAVANEHLLLVHEQAYCNWPEIRHELQQLFPGTVCLIEVSAKELSLTEAVGTYLFNSQLITLPGTSSSGTSRMLLVCPQECAAHVGARRVLDRILADDNPISEICFVDVRQSMRNGGGPACLRLRVPLTDAELQSMNRTFLLTDSLYEQLISWVKRRYREELRACDLADPQLAVESQSALLELNGMLGLTDVHVSR